MPCERLLAGQVNDFRVQLAILAGTTATAESGSRGPIFVPSSTVCGTIRRHDSQKKMWHINAQMDVKVVRMYGHIAINIRPDMWMKYDKCNASASC